MDFAKMSGELFSGIGFLFTGAGFKTLVMFAIAGVLI